MKILITTIIFIIYTGVTLAAPDDIYGVYESTFYQEMYSSNNDSSTKLKEAMDKAHITITINKEKAIMTIGRSEPESIEMKYLTINNEVIIAVDKEMAQEMYFPIYIKDQILYTAGQRFKKLKYLGSE